MVTKTVSGSVSCWKVIRVGGLEREELQRKVNTGQLRVWDLAKQVIGSMPVRNSAQDVRVEKCTVHDIGFREDPLVEDVLRAVRVSGEICPIDLVPHLFMALKDEKIPNDLLVICEPFKAGTGHDHLFSIHQNDSGKLILNTSYIGPNRRLPLSQEVVILAVDGQ